VTSIMATPIRTPTRNVQHMMAPEMQILLDRMDFVKDAVKDNSSKLQNFDGALKLLSERVDKMADDAGPAVARDTDQTSAKQITDRTARVVRSFLHSVDHDGESPTEDALDTDGSVGMSLLQGAYTQIRDSVQKVILPANLSMGDTGPNVKGESRKMMAFIRKTGGYTSTMLKIIQLVNDKDTPELADWDILYTCVLALHRLVLAEQTFTVYEGNGLPADTLNMYRFFSKNSFISKQETQALENATRVTSAINDAKKSARSMDNTSRRGGFNGRFNTRGRGNFFRGAGRDQKSAGNDFFDSTVTAASSSKP
jgi:hypothetical protein